MYIATVPNRGSPPALLLREGYRLGGTVKNRTLANLTKWPPQKVDLLRRLLRDEPVAPVDTVVFAAWTITRFSPLLIEPDV